MTARVGIDIRVLQSDHKFRGIGEVARQTLSRLLPMIHEDRSQVIFYRYRDNQTVGELVDIPDGLAYEEVVLNRDPIKHKRGIIDKLKSDFGLLYGSPIKNTSQCDVFLQFDYALGVPRNTKTVLIKHDIIPYIFWDKYFTSPWTHFKNKAARTTLRTIYRNYAYKKILRRSLRSAKSIICVSDHTRKDLHKYFRTSYKKMETIHLGVGNDNLVKGEIDRATLPTKPYLLFIGAVDAQRRSIEDLISAYNNLKADGHDIQLVLAGENFKSDNYIKKILPKQISKTILGSSYDDDIIKLGYINDATKKQLYRDAIAFVFPTRYEGFGIPILEAMKSGCPVITYKNSSIPEVAADCALYANGWLGIYENTLDVIAYSDSERSKFISSAKAHAKGFSWSTTVDGIHHRLKALQIK